MINQPPPLYVLANNGEADAFADKLAEMKLMFDAGETTSEDILTKLKAHDHAHNAIRHHLALNIDSRRSVILTDFIHSVFGNKAKTILHTLLEQRNKEGKTPATLTPMITSELRALLQEKIPSKRSRRHQRKKVHATIPAETTAPAIQTNDINRGYSIYGVFGHAANVMRKAPIVRLIPDAVDYAMGWNR